jgi:hypothetical protein
MSKFVKGISGNPVGRPKQKKHLSEALRDILQSTSISIDFVVNGNKKKVKLESDNIMAYGIAAKLVGSALEGNIRAIQTIFDRMEGKPLQSIERGIKWQHKTLF